MFTDLLITVLAIFVMIAAGFLARKAGMLDPDGTRQMAVVGTNIFYPCLIFSSLFSQFNSRGLAGNWTLPAGAVLIMATGYAIGLVFSALTRFDSDRQKNAFRFQCTINNYTYLPMPIILMLWGNGGVARLVLASLGSELSVWTLGILVLTGNRFNRGSLRNLFSAPMAALAVSVLLILARDAIAGSAVRFPSLLARLGNATLSVVEMMGRATVPMAMLIAGSRMAGLTARQALSGPQVLLAVLRLLVIPAAAVALLFVLPFTGDVRNILIVVAVMPAAVASVLLSEVYGADTDFTASCVLATHLFSLVTIPVWLALLLP